MRNDENTRRPPYRSLNFLDKNSGKRIIVLIPSTSGLIYGKRGKLKKKIAKAFVKLFAEATRRDKSEFKYLGCGVLSEN
jgi:hypothetical protein